MPKKFDTNPLDPDFPEKAVAATQDGPDVEAYRAPAASPGSPYSTAEFPVRPTAPPSVTEDETQRFTEAQFNAYAFQGGQVPTTYQQSPFAENKRPGERKVAGVGIPEKWLIAIPYLPFWFGLVGGLLMLLFVPKEENRVRFHAAQGFAAQIAIAVISMILGIVGGITDSNFGSAIFGAVTTVMMIIFAIKAFKGKPVHIEPVDDLTNWLEDKIGPIKS